MSHAATVNTFLHLSVDLLTPPFVCCLLSFIHYTHLLPVGSGMYSSAATVNTFLHLSVGLLTPSFVPVSRMIIQSGMYSQRSVSPICNRTSTKQDCCLHSFIHYTHLLPLGSGTYRSAEQDCCLARTPNRAVHTMSLHAAVMLHISTLWKAFIKSPNTGAVHAAMHSWCWCWCCSYSCFCCYCCCCC